MNIVFACDHAGFALKESLKEYVTSLGHTVFDVGAHEYVEGDDYPSYIAEAGRMVSENPVDTRAILVGGSGQGEAIVANRFPRVRAVVFVGNRKTNDSNEDLLTLTREHNNANVLSLGARFLTQEEAQEAVYSWLTTDFPMDERHVRRIQAIETHTQQ